MPTNNAKGLGVMADLAGVVRIAKAASTGITGNQPRIHRAEAALKAVAELVSALRESRTATQAFANDGQPSNWVRYEASERRLEAALRQVEGQ